MKSSWEYVRSQEPYSHTKKVIALLNFSHGVQLIQWINLTEPWHEVIDEITKKKPAHTYEHIKPSSLRDKGTIKRVRLND
jgi:hypothetical protein